jgi:sulfide:quinone oxidoreductase
VAIDEVTVNSVRLSTGEVLPSRLTQLMPPFVGVDFVQNSPSLYPTANWYIPVEDTYKHKTVPYVWAAGIAVPVDLPFECKNISFSAPKTGYPSDETRKIVAENIVRLSQSDDVLKRKP